jgi:phage-related protein
MRFLLRFWLPLLVLALTTSSSSFTCLANEDAATDTHVKKETVDAVADEAEATNDAAAQAAAAQMEAEEALAAKQAAAAAAEERAAAQEAEAAAAAQQAQEEREANEAKKDAKKVVDETKNAAASALSSLKDKLVTVKENVSKKTSLVTDKIKNVSPSHAKKIAAGVLGVWGVSVGAGWVAQNINKAAAPEEEAIKGGGGGRRK